MPEKDSCAERGSKGLRRRVGKSRNGCSRCKDRRVRCDEQQPACGNCVKYGSSCPGYQQQLKWSIKHEHWNTTQLEQTTTPPREQRNFESRPLTLMPSFEHPTIFEQEASQDNQSGGDMNVVVCSGFPAAESLIRDPIHFSTVLIEHWFRVICPLRSVFDSDVNYNRLLAAGTWDSSEAVFLTLQAMAAACLSSTMPHIRTMLPSLASAAIATVEREIRLVRSTVNPVVTVDLIFATFALGSSLHWMKEGPPEYKWLDYARELLALWKTDISPMYAMLQAHFRQALTYWEMCMIIIGRSSIVSQTERKRYSYREKAQHPLQVTIEGIADITPPSISTHWSTRPNSWCGVSEEIIHCFGQVLALCLKFRTDAYDLSVSDILCDTIIADQLRCKLMALDIDTLVYTEEAKGFDVQTHDVKTPMIHLTETAKAYRQAALLQLDWTFGTQIETEGCDNGCGITSQDHSVLEQASQLITTLQGIPVHSGASTIHPILYLCAAAALKPSKISNCNYRSLIGSERQHTWHLQISQARDFILDRLHSLKRMLPHRTSDNIIRLVKTLWSEYDQSDIEVNSVHWMEVTVKSGFGIVLR